VDDPAGGVRAVYAGPLKALINDQFRRLEDLCERAEIPVHKWHGDVGAAAKRRLLEGPSGVLLITPESIESLFVNHPRALPALFGRLGFVVIDELHAFLGTERGAHLRSLVVRLALKSREPVRRLGLSATLGDPDAARRWLRPGEPDAVRWIEDRDEATVRLRLSGYVRPRAAGAGPDAAEPAADNALAADVVAAFSGETALIFANSKARLELCADFARREAERLGRPDRFRVHHGSLSRAGREEVEEALRSGRPTATFCSGTLELGLDVGHVTAVGQIGAPWSVASLAQRLGRSGRTEGEAARLRIYIEEEAPEAQADLVDRLFPELLQAIAMTELLLRGWCEPPDVDRLHLSTLVQQVLSLVAERAGAPRGRGPRHARRAGAFAAVDRPTFLRVLRDMGASDLLAQEPDGRLVLGLKGEAIVRGRDFYAAFPAAEDYRVTHGGRHVGDVTRAPGEGADGYLLLAGRRWKVLEVDVLRKTILVAPSRGGRVPLFRGAGGPDIHPRVRAAMRDLLARDDEPRLPGSPGPVDARRRAGRGPRGRPPRSPLRAGRAAADLVDLDRLADPADPGGARPLRRHARRPDDGIALSFARATEAEVRETYRRFLDACPAAEDLAPLFPDRSREKYEPFLSEALQARSFARDALDLAGRPGDDPSPRGGSGR
jgi:ATP-dependent Lhr-like helicase